MKRHQSLYLFTIIFCLSHFISVAQNKAFSIKFSDYKTDLSKDAMKTLKDVAEAMKNFPDSNLAVIVNCGGTENRKLAQANWDRPNNIINYLVKKSGIAADRFIFKYGSGFEDCNIVSLMFTDEKITTDAPPHPNLRKKQL